MDKSAKEEIILVDERDQEIGYGEKLDVHVKAKLHRAFSIFIIDQETGDMFLQKRAHGKYHSGGKWSNACCSHPRRGEELKEALPRRLHQEIGISTPQSMDILPFSKYRYTKLPHQISEVGVFKYFAAFEGLAEHEVDHVFLYYLSPEQRNEIDCDPEEIAEFQWIKIEDLKKWLGQKPEDFSAWFAKAFSFVRDCLKEGEENGYTK